MAQRLVYNVTGQTLSHVPSTRQATIAWVLEDLRYAVGNASRTLQSATATVDAATEATTAAAGPSQANPRLLTVASTAGFTAGEFYEIVGTNGEREHFELAGLISNVSLLTKHPLIGSYLTGATLQGITCTTAAISASIVQDEDRVIGDYPTRITWTYADGTRHQEQVRIVREDASDLFVASIVADCRDVFPDIDTRMQYQGRDTLAPHVRTVIRQFRADALERGAKIEEWLTGEAGHWACVWRTLWHLARLGNVPANVDPREFSDYCKGEYMRRWDGLMVGVSNPEILKTEPVTGTSVAPAYQPIWGEL